MNKKYMDFVPVKHDKTQGTSRLVAVETIEEEIVTVVDENVFVPDDMSSDRVNSLNAKFVRTDVPKRPLSRKSLTAGDALAAMKARDIKIKKIPKDPKHISGAVSGATEMTLKPEVKKSVYQTPKTRFINQEKVTKRPLSRNVYLREIEKDKEMLAKEPKNIVVSSSEPEKKSFWKTFLAIILTIIVGAVAGALAFLLLPK